MNNDDFIDATIIAEFSKNCLFFQGFIERGIKLHDLSPRTIAAVFCEVLSSTLADEEDAEGALEQFVELLKERTQEKREGSE